MNFGLVKSQQYADLEKSLIEQAKSKGQEEIAIEISKSISKRVPGGVLDTNGSNTNFILWKKKDMEIIPYEVGRNYTYDAIKTLVRLDAKLENFDKNIKRAKRLSPSKLVEIWNRKSN